MNAKVPAILAGLVDSAEWAQLNRGQRAWVIVKFRNGIRTEHAIALALGLR